MRSSSTRLAAWVAAGLLPFLCGDAETRAAPAAAVDFTRFVAVGDSLTAGYADGSLFDGQSGPAQMQHEGQRECYAARLAAAMGAAFKLPLIPYPGPPGTTLLQHVDGACAFGPAAFTLVSGSAPGREDPFALATILGVPGQSMGAAMTTKWSIDPTDLTTVNSLEDLILGLPYAFIGGAPKSQIETAVGLAPTFVSVWLGNNDALFAATQGDSSLLTSAAQFDADAAVFAALKATGAQGVVANVPDVTVIPYFVSQKELKALASASASEKAHHKVKVSDASIRALFGVRKGDLVTRTPTALQVDVPGIAAGTIPLPLPPGDVLKAAEIRKIRAATAHYNRTLSAAAKANGWAFVDAAKLLTGLAKRGTRIGDHRLTTKYLGGIFGMDGVHPTSTGHAVIAQAFLAAINKQYHTQLPLPDLAAIVAVDPLAQCGKK